MGDVPFHLKWAIEVTHPLQNRSRRQISACNVSTVTASEKSSIMTNRKSYTRFPTSYRWSAYVTSKSPKGWLKKWTFPFFTARRSYASTVLGVVILSVRLSVLLSVCHTLIQRTYRRYFTLHERAILLVFCHPTVVDGRHPLPPKLGNRSDPALQKSLTSTDFRL